MHELSLSHNWYRNEPGADREWVVSLMDNCSTLSSLNVIDRKMRIGRARIKVGGVLGVETDEKHRCKGYATRVMNSALDRMTRERYGMSVLHGIRDFYHRFGYAPVVPDSRLYIPTDDLKRARRSFPVRKMRALDAPAVRNLYNRLNSRRNGTHVRPSYWTFFEGSFRVLREHPKPCKAVVCLDTGGRLLGYAAMAYNADRYAVSEIEGSSRCALESIARHIGESALRRGIKEVEFRLPPDHLFGRVCLHLGGRWEIDVPRNHGRMARIIDIDALFAALMPESRKRAEGLAWDGKLVLESELGSVSLGLSGSGKDAAVHVFIPQMVLSQLVLGYSDVDTARHLDGVKIPGRALGMLRTLFPLRNPYLWWSDRF